MATTSALTYNLWTIKDIRTHETFSGDPSEFESYFFALEAEITEMGWKDLLDGAIRHQGTITPASIVNAEIQEVNRNLSTFLSMRMRGKAQTMTRLAGAGNGFEAIRQIYADYRPQGATSEHSLMMTIVQPKWWTSDQHAKRNFVEILHDWDELCSQYELLTGDPISERLRCATIIGHAPLNIKKMLESSSKDVRESYSTMRTRIREHCLEKDPKAFVPRAPEPESTPMEVGAIGFDKPRCSVCNRLGHTASQCWFKGGKAGAKGKAQDPGGKGANGGKDAQGGKGGKWGGKPSNPNADKECHYCKKKGHVKADCFKRKKDIENGKHVAALEGEAAEEQGEVDALMCLSCSEPEEENIRYCASVELDGEDECGPRSRASRALSRPPTRDKEAGPGAGPGAGLGPGPGAGPGAGPGESITMPITTDETSISTALPAADDEWLMLDGGSDEHCARPSFVEGHPLASTSVKLLSATRQKVELDGECEVPYVLGDKAVVTSRFQVGPFSRNLLSTGKVFDAGFDIVYSHDKGCFVGITRPDGTYMKVPMIRKKNTFGVAAQACATASEASRILRHLRGGSSLGQGLVAATEGMEVDEGNGGRNGEQLAPPVPMAEGSASSSSGGPPPELVPPGSSSDQKIVPKPVEPRDPSGAELGPNSKIDLLKKRLKELGGAIYGTKQELWTRLKEVELKHKRDMEFKAAVQRRYDEEVGGQPHVEAKAVEAPGTPTEIEKAQHEASGHAVFKAWCPACVFGMGPEDPHRKQPVLGDTVREELMFFDWAFNATKDHDNTTDEGDQALGASLIAADRSTGFLYGNALGSKAADDHTVKQMDKFIKQLGYQRPEIRCDTEPAVKALQDKIVQARYAEGLQTRVSQGRTRDSQSMGFIETRIRWWRGRLKANRVMVEMNYGVKLTPTSSLWPFLANYAANVINWFTRGTDGYTAYFALHGVNFNGYVVPFGETVIAKVPVSKTGQRKGMTRLMKADSGWVKAIWVGKTSSNDEHILLTTAGKITCRTVRRLPAGRRHDKELLLKVCGEPWKDRMGMVPRALVLDPGRGPVVPTPIEESTTLQSSEPSLGPAAGASGGETLQSPEPRPEPTAGAGVSLSTPPLASSASSTSPSLLVTASRDPPTESAGIQPSTGDEGVGGGQPGGSSSDRQPGHTTQPSVPSLEPAASASADPMDQDSSQPGQQRPRSPTTSEDGHARGLPRRRFDDAMVGAIEDISQKMDYSTLLSIDEITHWDSSDFPKEEAAVALAEGLSLCDEYGIYSVKPASEAVGKKKVDTKWEKKDRAGKLKYRLVGREFTCER